MNPAEQHEASIRQRRELRIVTDFWAKPIPLRQFDWSAVRDGYEGGDSVGYGRTEAEAIADLLEQEEGE